MAIEFLCPFCGEAYRLKDELAGKKAKCKRPTCQQMIVIPQPGKHIPPEIRATITFPNPPGTSAAATAPAGASATTATSATNNGTHPAAVSTPAAVGAATGDLTNQAASSSAMATPAVTASAAPPVDAELLAASALADEPPPAAETGPTKTISFTCSYCDETIEVEAARAGKNMPCPHCRSMIRVPTPTVEKKKDWRDANLRQPLGGLLKSQRDEMEKAGVVGPTYVTAESLAKANELHEEREPTPPSVWIQRGLWVAGLIACVVFAYSMISRSRVESRVKSLMETAVKELESQDPLLQAAIHRAAGEHELRTGTREGLTAASKHFKSARQRLLQATAPTPYERNELLTELAIAQAGLGGSVDEAKSELKLSWPEAQKELVNTMKQLKGEPEQRFLASRRLAARLIALQQETWIRTIVGNPQVFANKEVPEALAQVALELLQAGLTDFAKELVQQGKQMYGEGKDRTAPTLQALLIYFNDKQLLPNFAMPAGNNLDPSPYARQAWALALALQGKFDDAKKVAEAPGNFADRRLRAIVAVLSVAFDAKEKPAEITSLLETGKKIVDGMDKNARTQSAWLILRLAYYAGRAGRDDWAKDLPKAFSDEALAQWAKWEALQGRLQAKRESQEAVEDLWLEEFPASKRVSTAAVLAHEAIARHNVALGKSDYRKTVEGWEAGSLRPFGYAGVALGIQDRTQP